MLEFGKVKMTADARTREARSFLKAAQWRVLTMRSTSAGKAAKGAAPRFRMRVYAKGCPVHALREVHLLQRKESSIGKGLGKTTGWVHRAELKKAGVHKYVGVSYDRIDDEGLHITVDGEPKVIEVDNVIVCTGQESDRSALGAGTEDPRIHVIGGADVAAELDGAQKPHPIGFEGAGQRIRHRLDRGVVGGHAVAQQAVRGGQAVDQIHDHAAPGLVVGIAPVQQCLAGVDTGRAGPDHGHTKRRT